jgi:hypothetical protein
MRHILKLHRDLDTNSLPQADHDYTIETFDPAFTNNNGSISTT